VAGGGEGDERGTVEFIATYRDKNGIKRHHEIGEFERSDGRWYFLDGKAVAQETARRGASKVGRNAPCPCGSGRKFKRCCGG